jgi:hypothetical protein
VKNAIKKLVAQPTQFERLVDGALAIYTELYRSTTQFEGDLAEKMSAKGFVAEALENARCDLATIEKLDKTVSKLRESDNKDLVRFVAQATKQAAATRMSEGVSLRPPTTNLHHFVGSDNGAFVAVLVQGSMLGTNPLQLIALAALRATREAPDAFGPIDSWDEHHAQREEKQARLAALYQRIAEEWRQADIDFEGIRGDGYAKIMLTCKGVTIPLGDPATLGERLCAALA